MRKRLIGKAFAVAMTGAMAFTATPVTANIFNVAHIVKAAEADQADEWTYCYVGLTWAEYWANEGVYNADNTESSDVQDSHYEYDKGGFDAVTRATTNHGLHRGSFQGNTVIHAVSDDGKEKDFTISHWGSDENKNTILYQTSNDATGVIYAAGTITDIDGTKYTLKSYNVLGTKYVPVKVKTSDFEAFKEKYKGKVVENGGKLVGGYAEGKLKSYSEIANVTANTYGLKTATMNSDGSFSFSKRSTEGTESGIEGKELKDASSVVKPELRTGAAVGSFGESIRFDINGDYGDLGSNMQSVKWTFYGNDESRTNAVKTYGTKFASDNWMHKSMGIQLGLTESNRFDLSGDDAIGYWTVTVTALGYKDYSYNFQVTKDDIATHELATSAQKAALEAKINEAESLNKDDYCADSYTDMTKELKEAKDALNHDILYAANLSEPLEGLTDAVNSLKKHDYKDTLKEAASFTKDGSIIKKCANCDDIKNATIAKIKSIALNKTSFTENGKVQKPSVTVKDSANKTIAASNYTVSYSNTKSTNPGTYKVTVNFKGNYTGTKTLSYNINAVAPVKTTVKLSSAKKSSLKVSWKKVSKATSYEVQYGTSKSFKGAKTVKVSSKSSSKVLTKLKKNKKYYVRVRAVRTVKVDNKNTTLRASWSSAKNLKTKKK